MARLLQLRFYDRRGSAGAAAPVTADPWRESQYSRMLKDVLKGAAAAATARPGPLQDLYHGLLQRGVRQGLAKVQLAAMTLRVWKRGGPFDPTKLTKPARPRRHPDARGRERLPSPAASRCPDAEMLRAVSLLRDLETFILRTARGHGANTLYRLRTVPGIGNADTDSRCRQ